MIEFTRNASGLYVPIPEPRPEPEPEVPSACCAGCGKPCFEALPIIGWTLDAPFDVHWPTCGHGKYVVCSQCCAANRFPGCPICGCQCDYT